MVRDVLGPMQELAREAPWFPLGEAMVVAAEGDHRKALEQLDLVLTHPEPEVARLCARRGVVHRGALSPRARQREPTHRTPRLALVRSSSGGRATDETRSMRSCAEPIGPHRRRTETSRPASARSRAWSPEGLTNAAIAKQLYISPRTAAVHVSNILAKLGLANRSELTAWAVRSGLAAANE